MNFSFNFGFAGTARLTLCTSCQHQHGEVTGNLIDLFRTMGANPLRPDLLDEQIQFCSVMSCSLSLPLLDDSTNAASPG